MCGGKVRGSQRNCESLQQYGGVGLWGPGFSTLHTRTASLSEDEELKLSHLAGSTLYFETGSLTKLGREK